jgi:hypothetical protein
MPDFTAALGQLRAHDPARALPPLTITERVAIRERIVAAQPAHTKTHGAARRSLHRKQRRRRIALAAGLTIVGVALAGVFGSHTTTAPQSALAAQMDRLARIAAGQAWTGIPGPGQYLYTDSKGVTTLTMDGRGGRICHIQQLVERKSWIATDGAGAIGQTLNRGFFSSPQAKAGCAAAGITDPTAQRESMHNRFGAGGLSFPTRDWHSLSTDPATLLVQLRTLDGGPRTAAEDFVHIGDFMRESDTPPAIRAALYKAAALIPGVKLMGPQADPTGRTGLGVGFYASGNVKSELIFDQQTGRLLAEKYEDAATGKLTDWTAYLSQKIVSADKLPDYPMTPPSTDTTASVNGN